MVGRDELERRLGYHPATDPARVAAFELIRQQTIELATLYDEVCPPGRELAEALTNLQTAQQYAIGAVACHPGEYESPASSRASSVALAFTGATLVSTCAFRTHYVGDPYGGRGRWLDCALPAGHDGVHRTSDGAGFE